MSLTLADVLALPGLDSMRLRAGQAGRDNAVRWPGVAENEGIADWVMGGELIFVTGINHRLNIHRNTLSYRLQRIEALTGCSFEDPHDRLNISVALLIRRLSSPA